MKLWVLVKLMFPKQSKLTLHQSRQARRFHAWTRPYARAWASHVYERYQGHVATVTEERALPVRKRHET
jgi:hypothetical protein